MNAPNDKEFIFSDGRRAKNSEELAAIIETLPDDVFAQFLNNSKNDFATWYEKVFFNESLAQQLRRAHSKHDVLYTLHTAMHEAVGEKMSTVTDGSVSMIEMHGSAPSSLQEHTHQSDHQHEEYSKDKSHHFFDRFHLKQHHDQNPLPHATHEDIHSKDVHLGSDQHQEPQQHQEPHYHPEHHEQPEPQHQEQHHQEYIHTSEKTDQTTTHVSPSSSGESAAKHMSGESFQHVIWVFIYGLIIVLIVALLLFKFVL